MPESSPNGDAAPLDVGAYCREVEGYLCRRNGGHLIRVVGPAFQLVARWAETGVPLRVVLHGIDRTVTRREARGPQRRPVRLEFCEADVEDAFAQWRRAVGPAGVAAAPVAEAPPVRRGPSLGAHLDRVMLRLSSLRAATPLPPAAAAAVDAALAELDALVATARQARGETRQAVRDALARIDDVLVHAVTAALDDEVRGRLAQRAHDELRPMRARLDGDVYDDAHARLVRQLARVELGLPEIVLP